MTWICEKNVFLSATKNQVVPNIKNGLVSSQTRFEMRGRQLEFNKLFSSNTHGELFTGPNELRYVIRDKWYELEVEPIRHVIETVGLNDADEQ